jgi:hypothetical protein
MDSPRGKTEPESCVAGRVSESGFKGTAFEGALDRNARQSSPVAAVRSESEGGNPGPLRGPSARCFATRGYLEGKPRRRRVEGLNAAALRLIWTWSSRVGATGTVWWPDRFVLKSLKPDSEQE